MGLSAWGLGAEELGSCELGRWELGSCGAEGLGAGSWGAGSWGAASWGAGSSGAVELRSGDLGAHLEPDALEPAPLSSGHPWEAGELGTPRGARRWGAGELELGAGELGSWAAWGLELATPTTGGAGAS